MQNRDNHAGFIVRLFAYLIDRLIISLPFIILGILIVLNGALVEDFVVSLGLLFIYYLIGYTVSSLVLGLGFFWVIKDSQKRAWHDMLIGSKVVVKEKDYLLGIL